MLSHIWQGKGPDTDTPSVFTALPCNHLIGCHQNMSVWTAEMLSNFMVLSESSCLISFRFICQKLYISTVCVSCTCLPVYVCVSRWLDVLRHSLSVSDGTTGGGAESARAGQNSTLVHHEAAERLPRATQQTCRHMLLLLGGSNARGTDWCNTPSQSPSCMR